MFISKAVIRITASSSRQHSGCLTKHWIPRPFERKVLLQFYPSTARSKSFDVPTARLNHPGSPHQGTRNPRGARQLEAGRAGAVLAR